MCHTPFQILLLTIFLDFTTQRELIVFRNWITEKANQWSTKEKLNFYTQQVLIVLNHNGTGILNGILRRQRLLRI